MSIVRDVNLAPEGAQRIGWVRKHMPLLEKLEQRFVKEQPLADLRVTLSIHVEAKTARLAQMLRAGGAQVMVSGCNPLSTQDAVAAALMESGVGVFAVHDCTPEEYHSHLCAALEHKPHVILDDGGDLVQILSESRPELAEHIIAGSEETTTGVLRLKARQEQGKLPFSMVLTNDAAMKHLFDNRYGTGQSVWDGIMRTTNLLVAGQTVVVAGYGWCGKGVAMRAKGLGARVIVCEVDPVKAIEAMMDGFDAMTMDQAAPLGDVFITVTGCKDVIVARHMEKMKNGAVLCNAGHFNVEIDVEALSRMAVSQRQERKNIEGFVLPGGTTLYLLAEGRLVNLAAGDGHPAEIMDISFALQALLIEDIYRHPENYKGRRLYNVPAKMDNEVAAMKLSAMGREIDRLTQQQAAYLADWTGDA